MARILIVFLLFTLQTLAAWASGAKCSNVGLPTIPSAIDFHIQFFGQSNTTDLRLNNENVRGLDTDLDRDFLFSATGGLTLSDNQAIITVVGGAFLLKVTLPGTLPPGIFNGEVIVKVKENIVNQQIVEICRVPVTAEIVFPLRLSPVIGGFGNVVVGTSKTLNVNLIAGLPLIITSISLAPPFSVSTQTPPIVLGKGEGRFLAIIATPTQLGPQTANLIIKWKLSQGASERTTSFPFSVNGVTAP